MDPRRGKATRTASKAGAAAPKVSAPSGKGAPTKPNEPRVAPDAQRGSSSRASGSQRKSAPAPRERPRAGARGACAQEAPLNSGDLVDGQAGLAEGPEPPAAPGPPPARAGSRREGGAGSARERRPPPAPEEVPGYTPLVPAPGLGRREVAPGGWKPRTVLDKLRLRRLEISAAAEIVNKVMNHLQRRLQSSGSEFKGVGMLHTGSYYEHVKISAPNEFDVMFKLEVPRIQLEEYYNSGAHYFVKLKRNPKGNLLNQFLEGETLSASKVLSKFRKIIKEEIKNIEDIDIIMERKKPGSPAVTLIIRKPTEIFVDVILALEVKSSWPANTKKGLPVDNWLGVKVRRNLRLQPFYLVPKNAKEGNGFQEETWRLSFSHIEKEILNNHGYAKTCCESNGMKCCRKDCLKLMKCLLEQLKKKFKNSKEVNKFCSYHLKTAFLHMCTENPLDSQWHPKDLELCFVRCVEYFLQCLRTEDLKHYFIPGVNLFSRDQIDKNCKEFLSKEIEYEENNGFPVFGEI